MRAPAEPSADQAADPASALDLVARGSRAYAAGQMGAARQLLEQARAGAAREPIFWELDSAIALAAGDTDRGVASQERAVTLARGITLRLDPHLLLNLALANIAAGRAQAAVSARAAAAEAIAALLAMTETPRPEDYSQLRDVDARLARLLWDAGRHDDSISAMVRSLGGADAGDGVAYARIGAMLAWRGRATEALFAMMGCVLHSPDSADAARDLAGALARIGMHLAARAWFRRAVALNPDDAATASMLEQQAERADAPVGDDALSGRLSRPLQGLASGPGDPVWPMALARVLVAARGNPPRGANAADWAQLAQDVAVIAFRRSLAVRPGQPDAASALAQLLLERPNPAEGLQSVRAALKLNPADAMLHVKLGHALLAQGDPVGAAQSFRAALGLHPDLPAAMLGLAVALEAHGPDARVIELVDRALELDPDVAKGPILAIRAGTLAMLQRPTEALADWDQVLALAPDDVSGHLGRALALLALGRYAEGWPEYAWRWKRSSVGDAAPRMPDDPLRRPDPAEWAGRTVLLYSEQAQGDSIQFLRYARMAAATGARVLLEVHGALKTLAAGIPDIAGVFARGDDLPPHEIAVPLLHLPWAFDTRMETIPAAVPYLRADLTRAAQFRRRMQGLPGLKVGLVWSGDPRPFSQIQSSMDRRRSLTLAALAPLSRVPGLVFVSLQKGAAAAQATAPPDGMVLHDWTGELEDFAATAALMTALDLVISVDTAPAHLAGALGRQVWLLNRFDTDFRWLLGRDDSPWYPTLRQFRQRAPGHWDDVVQRVAVALQDKVATEQTRRRVAR